MVVSRFAPSPTGLLHIGSVRTVLYAFAVARHNKGKFIVRVEDTDRTRFVPGAEEAIFKMLDVLKLYPDERSRQSDRLTLYKEYAEKLIDSGHAYYCFSTKEEIAAAKELAIANGELNSKFISPYRDIPRAEAKQKIAAGEQYVVRQRIPAKRVIPFHDGVQGKMEFNSDEVDEGVLFKSDGFPTYHLAVVVDDHLMGVTHVFRGTEWIPSAPKHVLLYEAFGWEMPAHYHLPLILDPEGGKLSKRKGATSAEGFLREGYLPEALLNFLMLLGWSAPVKYEHGAKEREIFSLDDFIALFDPKDLNKSGAVFNRDKLLWFNQQHLSLLSDDEFENRFGTWLKAYGEDEKLSSGIIAKGPDYLQKALKLVRSRIKTLNEIPASLNFFFFAPEKFTDFASVKQVKNLAAEKEKEVASTLKDLVANQSEDFAAWPHEIWEANIRNCADELKLKAGEVFMIFRLALTATPFSPPLYEVMEILGREEVLRRLEKYCKKSPPFRSGGTPPLLSKEEED